MNVKLSNIKNGQHFCLKNNPKAIYQRIDDRVKLFREFTSDGLDLSEARIVVDAQCLTNNKKTVMSPAINVIALGEK